MSDRAFQAIEVRFAAPVCTVTIARPEPSNNAIDGTLIAELGEVITSCEDPARGVSVLVLRGQPQAFCTGGDFGAIVETGHASPDSSLVIDPAPLYDLWLRLATGPFVTISVVRGRVNAGGVGFVAASDIVLADPSASFGLSELLFGLLPACVLPFLVRRIGHQRAHYLTLMTSPVTAELARDWGLVDILDPELDTVLRQHLIRLRRLGRPGIHRYKQYRAALQGCPAADRSLALDTNRAMFADETVRADIRRYVLDGRFPWEP